MLSNRRSPLLPLRGPGSCDLQAALARRLARRRQRQAPGIERDQRQLESLALSPEHVLDRHLDVGEADDAVLQCPEAHEVEPLDDLHSGPVALHDERGYGVGTGPGHHDVQFGDGAIGAPELFAIQDVAPAILGEHRRRLDPGWIGTHAILRERERTDGALGEPGEVLPLLLFGSEKLEWLRQAD